MTLDKKFIGKVLLVSGSAWDDDPIRFDDYFFSVVFSSDYSPQARGKIADRGTCQDDQEEIERLPPVGSDAGCSHRGVGVQYPGCNDEDKGAERK